MPIGYKEWRDEDNKLHRDDGPAFIGWWICGINITTEVNEWMKENNITYPFSDEEKLLFKLRFA